MPMLFACYHVKWVMNWQKLFLIALWIIAQVVKISYVVWVYKYNEI